MSGFVMNVLQKNKEVNCECNICKLIKGSALNGKKCKVFYETSEFVMFEPSNKTATSHLIAVTKQHIEQNRILEFPKIFKDVSKKIDELFPMGWRIIINNGRDSLQVQKHAHIHILGNQRLENIGFL